LTSFRAVTQCEVAVGELIYLAAGLAALAALGLAGFFAAAFFALGLAAALVLAAAWGGEGGRGERDTLLRHK